MDLITIASIVGAEFNGKNIEITGMNSLKDASEAELTFVANSKYIKDIQTSKAGAILVDISLVKYVPENSVALVVDSSYWAMAVLSKYFAPLIEDDTLPEAIIGEGSKVSKKAVIANGAKIGKNSTILANVYIGTNSVIGDNTIIYQV